MLRPIPLSIVLLALAGCTSDRQVDPLPERSQTGGELRIQTTATEYSWPADGVLTVEASIQNESDQTFHARIGDGFNATMDQSLLFVAPGSDGAVEKRVGADWSPVETSPLFEGVKVIAIRPHSTYSLTAQVSNRTAGTHRIRLEYADPPATESSGKTYQSYSNVFVIR